MLVLFTMENNIDQKFILSNQKSPDKTEQWFSDEIQMLSDDDESWLIGYVRMCWVCTKKKVGWLVYGV